MKTIICDSNTKFSKFYLKNLFTNELEQCSEKEFDEIVTKHRSCYELVYDGANAQNFIFNGEMKLRQTADWLTTV